MNYRLRDRFLEFAQDGELRTAAEVAGLLGINLPSGASQLLLNVMRHLTIKRSHLRLKKYPPERGSRAIRWRLESRDPSFRLHDGRFLPTQETVEGQRGNHPTPSRRPGWRLPESAEPGLSVTMGSDDGGREASKEYSKSRGMYANNQQPASINMSIEKRKPGRPRKNATPDTATETRIETATESPKQEITDQHIEEIERAVYVKAGHWGVIDPKRLVEAVLQVMGGNAA